MSKEETKYALVTGANKGIGFALCNEFSKRGVKVFATDVAFSEESAATLKANGCDCLVMDVTNLDQIQAVEKQVAETTGNKLHYLYNNAGIVNAIHCVDQTKDELMKVFDINFFGAINVTNTFIKLVVNAKGTIVFSGSVTQSLPLHSNSIYTSSKAAINQWASTLQVELKNFDVKVLNVLGGSIDTEIFDTAIKPIPDSSIYSFTKYRNAFKFRKENLKAEAKNSVSMPTDVFAKKTIDKIFKIEEKDDKYAFNLLEGGNASRFYYLGVVVPRYFLVNRMLNIFKLNFDYTKEVGK